MKVLSLAMICGDSGVKTLGRLLKSVLFRPDGPLVDEIIIGWNGKDEAGFEDALAGVMKKIGFEPTGLLKRGQFQYSWVDFNIIRQQWKDRFDTARNEVFALATGEWVMWLDTDDVVACAADKDGPDGLKAIEAVERDYGMPPVEGSGQSKTLKQWLEALPFDANAVLAPYDYTINKHGYTVVRQTMKRIVRRNSKFVWRNAIHEILYPSSCIGEKSVTNLGFLVRHYPSEEVITRTERNRDIVLKMQTEGMTVDARHAFDLANAQITMKQYKAADDSLRLAISRSTNLLDTYLYRLSRAGLNMEMGTAQNIEAGLQECLAAVGTQPMRADAYFGACEAFYRLGQPEAAVIYFELGAARSAQIGPINRPLAQWVSPRAQAARCYLELGRPEKGLALAKEALNRYPEDELSKETFRLLSLAIGRAKTIDGLLDAAEYLLDAGGSRLAGSILQLAAECVPLRGISHLPRFQALKVKDEAFGPLSGRSPRLWLTGEDMFKPGPGDAVDEYSLDTNAHIYRVQVQEAVKDGDCLKVKARSTDKPSLAFVCPHAVELWKPSDVDTRGLGGSEGSVAYLARTLAKRGYPVRTYTLGGPDVPLVVGGITERNLLAFDPTNPMADLVVACRAPWMLRNPLLKVPTMVWHQDNGYDNDWSWNPIVDAASKGSLHVSDWAMNGLVKLLGTDAGHHHVIGNGVSSEFALHLRTQVPERNPKKVVYASDVTRGLAPLISMWPRVLDVEPEAELHVFGSYAVMLALAQTAPGVPIIAEMEKFSEIVGRTPQVFVHGWVHHARLAEEMLSAGIYAYPGGQMPEGFGVSLVQASAAGCAMVFPDAGALPEVLPNHRYMLPRESGLEAKDDFVQAILKAMGSMEDRVEQSVATWKRHNWKVVADRFEAAIR